MSVAAPAAAVELKVCIRCRTFSHKDKLGVLLKQVKEDAGEADLVNVEMVREMGGNRYGFGKTWWSAGNWKSYLENDARYVEECGNLANISQTDVYETEGMKILNELLDGQAVVMFAYGLSGAGKTYTVFGTDDPKSSQAWYKFDTPQEEWGLFPRLAYKLLELAGKTNGWKVRLKYYQNVADTVIDLLSSESNAKSCHQGMHKDAHGFMDMTWCKTVEVETWSELLATFTAANHRKSIAPTQFNPSSTRGHCILFYEVDMPPKHGSGRIKTARMYICDLAGVEPAADVHWARYKSHCTEDGHIEYAYVGKDPDRKKTHDLVEQGKAINLSLLEMSSFFRNMAIAMKHQNPKEHSHPTVVGCNNYFLGKFLKDTIMQAHTYVFAAVRPELQFQTYTRSTLEFAKNASVVKLAPRKIARHRGENSEMTVKMHEEIVALQTELVARTKGELELRKELEHMNSELVLLEQKNEGLLKQIDESQSVLKGTETLQLQCDGLRKVAAETALREQALQEDIDALKLSAASVRADCLAKEAEIASRDTKIKSLVAALSTMEGTVHRLETAMKSHDRTSMLQIAISKTIKDTHDHHAVDTIKVLEMKINDLSELLHEAHLQRGNVERELNATIQKCGEEAASNQKAAEATLERKIHASNAALTKVLQQKHKVEMHEQADAATSTRERLESEAADLKSIHASAMATLKAELDRERKEHKQDIIMEQENHQVELDTFGSSMLSKIDELTEKYTKAEIIANEKLAVAKKALAAAAVGTSNDDLATTKRAHQLAEDKVEEMTEKYMDLLRDKQDTDAELKALKQSHYAIAPSAVETRTADEMRPGLPGCESDEDTPNHTDGFMDKKNWKLDSLATVCAICGVAFSMFKRKHHCRKCGEVVCNPCSSQRVKVTSFMAQMRVCDDCFNTKSEIEWASKAWGPSETINLLLGQSSPSPTGADSSKTSSKTTQEKRTWGTFSV